MSLWDSMKKVAAQAGNAAMVAGHKTRLQGEIMLVDREIRGLKQKFGVDLYNHLGPLATSPDFFASDDPLTETLRPPLLAAQREIAALEIRRRKVKEDIKQAEVKRAAAFPDKAMSFADKAKNAAKSAALASNEAKLSTDLSVIESQIKHFKQKFGEDIFDVFVTLEDTKGWLPTDRTIRSMYDNARQGVEKAIKRRKDKISELESLGGSYTADKKDDTGYDAPTAPGTSSMPMTSSPAVPPAAAAAPAMPMASFSAAPAPVAPLSTDPKVQGLFATPDNPPPDMFSTPQPTAGFPSSSSSTTVPPIAQSGSYMGGQTTATGGGGYSDNSAMMRGFSDSPAVMGNFTNNSGMPGAMGGYSDQSPMGGTAAMGGFSNAPAAAGGFSDFSGFAPQPPSNLMGGGFQSQPPQPPNNSFGFPNTQTGSSNNAKPKTSGQPDDLLMF